MMIIDRGWGMPHKYSFTIKPIRELIAKYMKSGELWGDPFAGYHSPAKIRNDADPKAPAEYHLDALEFLEIWEDDHFDGIFFDPPYSNHEVKRHYEGRGYSENPATTFRKWKDAIARVVKSGGTVISLGWNSGGLGKKRGFEKLHIRLVPHGAHHNDTIVVVERKINNLKSFIKESRGD